MPPQHPFNKLLDVMARLCYQKGGCQRDLKPNFSTIFPYSIEEAYEVTETIQRQNFDH
ncbi:MAG: hypothetical protein IPH06_13975 [Alphaproteobacteria bacterium]|nr:hypothetical protein [Alphaproteobacteria bacterium]